MSVVYISVRLITPIGSPEQVLACFEFEAVDWMTALDRAYGWLKSNREETCTYHVYC
jgi:hypothetical protein